MLLATPFLALSLSALPTGSEKMAGNYPVNTSTSQIQWKARKVTGAHEGTVNLKTGNLEFSNGQLSGGYFEIDMRSIAVTDLTGDMKGKLEGHLKSDDFFGVEQFPTALFKISSVVSRGTAGEYKISGTATIKGKTKEIRFNARVNEQSGIATADIELDRTDFDVRYGSGSFFDNLGDKTIYDEFNITVNLAFTQR